jgi:hypothetical protein
LSPILIDRAMQRIQQAGLQQHVSMTRCDLNSWSVPPPERPYVSVLGNHILHHVVKLESLFQNVATAIGDEGIFLTADMIGRNGHMRWPEALMLLNELWGTLPEPLKYNHVSHRIDRAFINWDCSLNGFEGIRAQDILPLLVARFRFEKFLAFGNLPDAFCDRFYAPNFDPAVPAHTQFIDSIEQLNTLLLELGVIKPTMMFAVISNRGTRDIRIWKNLSPEFCVRHTGALDLTGRRQKSEALLDAKPPAVVAFCRGGSGQGLLGSGWSYSEEWGTWMIGTQATLQLPIPLEIRDRSRVNVAISARAFVAQKLHFRAFNLLVDDVTIGGVTFVRSDDETKRIELEVMPLGRNSVELRITTAGQACPADEGLADSRSLGLALIDAAIY